jgi:hypothetical protein
LLVDVVGLGLGAFLRPPNGISTAVVVDQVNM